MKNSPINMKEFEELVASKTLEEWAALNSNENFIFPEHRAPFAYKIRQRQTEIQKEIKELEGELYALSRL